MTLSATALRRSVCDEAACAVLFGGLGLSLLASIAACAPKPSLDGEGSAREAAPIAARSDALPAAITLTPLLDSPRFEGAQLLLDGVQPGSRFPDGVVEFSFTVLNFELGVPTGGAAAEALADSVKGQHIRLLLNDQWCSDYYELEFEQQLAPGHYVALALLSRSYHEGVKDDGAAVLTDFTVGGAERGDFDHTKPHLFYSRPEGVYTAAEAQRMLLDFYLVNTELSADGNKIRARIGGVEFLLTEWVPYVIEGLPPGETEVVLELIDPEDNPLPGPYNRVSRILTILPEDG